MQGMQRIRNKQLSLLVLAAIGVMAQSSVVLADDATKDAPTKLDKIEVTGSSIRRTDAETPSPVQIITADDLKKSGYSSVSEVLRNISANNQGTLSQSFSGAFATGASAISLRGLTSASTLVLIDGHRTAPYPISDDGQRSFVDISAIPFDAVERIEVLKDGASAVYGSDAIAGVVNVILKKQFRGTRVNAEVGTTQKGGGTAEHISVTTGKELGEGGDGYVSLEYRHQTPILAGQRQGILTNRDYRGLGGVDRTPGVANAINGGYPASYSGYTVSPSGVVTQLPGCGPGAPGYNYTGFCNVDNSFRQLQPDTHNVNLLGKFNQALANDWKLGLTGSVFSSEAEQVAGNSYTSTLASVGGLSNPALVPGATPSVYPLSGPYILTVPSTGDALNYSFPTAGLLRGE